MGEFDFAKKMSSSHLNSAFSLFLINVPRNKQLDSGNCDISAQNHSSRSRYSGRSTRANHRHMNILKSFLPGGRGVKVSPMGNHQSQKVKPRKEGMLLLSRLIENEKWRKVERVLSTTPPSISTSVTVDSVTDEDIILHFACQFDPPTKVIEYLAEIYSSSTRTKDLKGRYPIHLAAKYGASPEVICFLISTNPSAAGAQDDLGKTPMHYFGEYYLHTTRCDRKNGCERSEKMRQVVSLLKVAAPASVNLEDEEGMNAIEYALGSGVDMRVIRSMHRACQDDWRKRKQEHRGKRHADLESELKLAASTKKRYFISWP